MEDAGRPPQNTTQNRLLIASTLCHKHHPQVGNSIHRQRHSRNAPGTKALADLYGSHNHNTLSSLLERSSQYPAVWRRGVDTVAYRPPSSNLEYRQPGQTEPRRTRP
jgi:hypothetical protein